MATIKNYEQANQYLGTKADRPFANNTRIVRLNDGGIAATYHGHSVAKFYPDYSIYSSCGWKTSTTKERLNWFLPDGFFIYQSKSIWHLCKRGNWNSGWIFSDGVQIDNGVVLYAPTFDEQAAKESAKFIRKIKKFVDGYIAELLDGEMSAPSGGDCWYCYMQTEDGICMGDATNNHDHLLQHIEEDYYVPSIISNAEKKYPMSPIAKDGIARRWYYQEELGSWQRSVVERDVRSSLTRYLKLRLGIAQ